MRTLIRNLKRFLKISSAQLLTPLFLFLVNCSDQPLQPLTPIQEVEVQNATVTANFCTLPPSAPITQNVKYIFIVDKSGYNGPPGTTSSLASPDVSNTDPYGYSRFFPIETFLQNMITTASAPTYFQLITFNSALQINNQPPIVNPNSSPVPFVPGPASSFVPIINAAVPNPNSASSIPDSGFTDYVLALTAAYNSIVQDINSNTSNGTARATGSAPPIKSLYQIIFISGGIPLNSSNSYEYIPTTVPITDPITPIVQALINLPQASPTQMPMTAPSGSPTLQVNGADYVTQVSLSTAYYFNPNSGPITPIQILLQKMATAGNGYFFEFGAGAGINYQQLSPPVLSLKSQLADVFVENENVVWWDDGTLQQDSDGDGLPDSIEAKFGSNPLLKDSDGNGVSDLVEYRLYGQPCASSQCNSTLANPFSVCVGFGSVTSPGIYPDSDSDGLNDCEEFLIGSNRYSFSTPGNFIPDFLAFKNNLSILPDIDQSQSSPLGDSLSNYTKLKLGLPTNVQSKVPKFLTRVTDLERVSEVNNTDCYQMTVSNIALMGSGNRIKISIVENKAVIDNLPTIRIAEKTLNGNSTQLNFSNGDFQ